MPLFKFVDIGQTEVMLKLTKLQENWRGMTVSSMFQIPGFTILVIVSLAVGVTMLFCGHVEDVDKKPNRSLILCTKRIEKHFLTQKMMDVKRDHKLRLPTCSC